MTEVQNEYLSVTAILNATDSLETALASLGRDDDMKWKWVGFSLHHALYSFSVAALHNANWETVVSSGRDDQKVYSKQGDDPWYKCRKVRVPDTKNAYRLVWELIQGEPPSAGEQSTDFDEASERMQRFSKAKLIGFWTALARVQDGHHWMNRYVNSRPLTLTDKEVQDIAWVTDHVRNRLMHFVPSMSLIGIESVRQTSLVALQAISFLISESNTLLFRNLESKRAVEATVENLRKKLEAEAP